MAAISRHNHKSTRMLARRSDRGFAIVAVASLLAVTVVVVCSITLETSRKLSMVRHSESQINARLMARSGLERALTELGDHPTVYNGTRMTEVEARNVYVVSPPERGNNMIKLVSIGVADAVAREIQATIVLESGLSGIFDKAIYAGNVPPDPEDQENLPYENLVYSLDFGGDGVQGDYIDGDIYSGNDLQVDDDAAIVPVSEETFTDVNGNGVYDRGDYLTMDINGNGTFDADATESFDDANSNGVWDAGESYDDLNSNGQYDASETFIDYDRDAYFDLAEPFDDSNDNDRYDYGIEAVGEVDYHDESEADGGDEPLLPPTLSDMNYSQTADIIVADRFGGIDSGTLPADNAAHIFVKNPSGDGRDHIVDETFELNGEQINPDDYFLEDPYEPIESGSTDNSINAARISLTGGPSGKEEDGNHVVYYIEGNLYIHKPEMFTFRIQDAENKGVRVTFIVEGNIVMADNFYYRNGIRDQVAFIAMCREDDPKGEISGNIYMGDPEDGTLRHIDGLLYAENNFYDNNLDKEGAQHFEIYGNMSAGNRVAINRDYIVPAHHELRFVDGRWEEVLIPAQTKHSAMSVYFDDRYVDGPNGRERLTPGLPMGPRRDSETIIRLASVRDVGRADVPHEYFEMYNLVED